jgi:DNA-binding transcriptional ArsR family regulator
MEFITKRQSMGASKLTNYSQRSLKLSQLAGALSHAARIDIISHLRANHSATSMFFQQQLGLSKSTVYEHVLKLRRAELVEIEYFPNYYALSLNGGVLDELADFILEPEEKVFYSITEKAIS